MPILEGAHSMSGPGFAGSGSCVVPEGVQGTPGCSWRCAAGAERGPGTARAPWLTAGIAVGWRIRGGMGEALGPGGGGWRPVGTHSAGSRQLRWVKACVLTPFSKDVSPLAPGLLDIHSASRVLSAAEADVALSLQQVNAFCLEPCSELSTRSFDRTTFS